MTDKPAKPPAPEPQTIRIEVALDGNDLVRLIMQWLRRR